MNTIRVGKYVLMKEVSKGRYGVCYKAKNDRNEYFAIKKIESLGKKNEVEINNEINILRVMKHENSVEFIESFQIDGYFYIVMELCDGDLNYFLKKYNGNISIVIIMKILLQLNKVLELMHKKQIEHRDLKLENILIKIINQDEFIVKLTDYGFSKYYEINYSKYSNAMGTIYFSAPEVYDNNGNSKSDLWSIGMILYYLYFNQLPFKNKEEFFNPLKNVNLKKTQYKFFDDLLIKLINKNNTERISWNDYFKHPFNNSQLIEIYVTNNINNNNIQILNNEYFQINQLKDSIMFNDENQINFTTNLNLNEGKYKIYILFNNFINSCESMFDGCKDLNKIKFINFETNKVTDMSFMFNGCSNLIDLDVSNFIISFNA